MRLLPCSKIGSCWRSLISDGSTRKVVNGRYIDLLEIKSYG